MIRLVVALLLLTVIDYDVDRHIQAALQPANMDGTRLAQMAVEQGEHLMDAFPPAPCYAGWWALRRSSYDMLGRALTAHRSGDSERASAYVTVASALRHEANREPHTC